MQKTVQLLMAYRYYWWKAAACVAEFHEMLQTHSLHSFIHRTTKLNITTWLKHHTSQEVLSEQHSETRHEMKLVI